MIFSISDLHHTNRNASRFAENDAPLIESALVSYSELCFIHFVRHEGLLAHSDILDMSFSVVFLCLLFLGNGKTESLYLELNI